DAAEEQHDLVLRRDLALRLWGELRIVLRHTVVDHADFFGLHAVTLGHDVLGQHADGDHTNCGVHAASLDVVDRLVDMLAGTVEFGGVDVGDQRLAGHASEGHA